MLYRVNHPQVINETIEGEAIMINLVTGNYYSLDSVGGEVWDLLEQGSSTDEIVARLNHRYEAPTQVIHSAVEGLLQQLASEQLVIPDDRQESAPANVKTPPLAVRSPFTVPRLEKFTDMQDLILLDPVHEVDQRGWPHAADSRVN